VQFNLVPTFVEQTLYNGQTQVIVATLYANERPLCGLASSLDWAFQGIISAELQAQHLTGALGEIIYIPIIRQSTLFSLLLLGCGSNSKNGDRPALNWMALGPG
jgi:hypothetical protein